MISLVSHLLSQDSIDDLRAIFKNSKELTAEAALTSRQARKMIESSKTEVDTLINLASELSNRMIVLTDNVNSSYW
ncbi:MAG: hypothetical protein MZU97_02520 [Bacillus subtilis]|nr:hypothetical protein [Bacillus subtilis]